MSGNKVTIKLTADQQKQIKEATGRTLSELNVDFSGVGELSDNELDKVVGGSVSIAYEKIEY